MDQSPLKVDYPPNISINIHKNMANKKIKYLNYLQNNNLLVLETKSVCQDEIAWIVLSSCEGQDNDYSFKIRTECFKKDDIENGYDVIGNHSFSEYIYFNDIQSLDMYLNNINIRLEDFIESWNCDYPL